MDQEITVRHNDDAIDIDIEDLSSHCLQKLFKLSFEPTTLVYRKPNGNRKAIDISKLEKFQPGNTYYLEEEQPPQATQKQSLLPFSLGLLGDANKKSAGIWLDNGMPEVVANASACSQASYASTDEECLEYFKKEIERHSLCNVTISKHTDCHFIIAEEDPEVSANGTERVYIAFRGSTLSASDWAANLRFYQVENLFWDRQGQVMKGKVHAGFLEKASQFPMETILSDEDFEDREIILCGHSLGGAIATIVAVNMTVAATKRYEAMKQGGDSVKKRVIKCVTFGAPMVGDSAFRKLCDDLEVSQNLFNVVNCEDPVPRLLSFAQGISASTNMLEQLIRTKVSDNREQDVCFQKDREEWIIQKDSYNMLLAKTMAALNVTIDAGAVLFPEHSKSLSAAKLGASLIREVVYSSDKATSTARGKQLTYEFAGNYFFCVPKEGKEKFKLMHHQEGKAIDACFEQCLRGALHEGRDADVAAFHSCSCYVDVVLNWRSLQKCPHRYGKHKYVTVATFFVDDIQPEEKYVPRTMEVKQRYQPHATSGEITVVNDDDTRVLRLTLYGQNMLPVIKEKCYLGGLFHDQQVDLKGGKMRMPSNEDRLSFEQVMDSKAPPLTIGDLGITVRIITIFGNCQFRMGKGNMRKLKLESVKQLCYESSTSILIQRAIQRGIAVSQIKSKMGQSQKNSINQELASMVFSLSLELLGKPSSDHLAHVFKQTGEHVQFLLTNRKEFEKIQDICIQLEKRLTEPLKLTLEKSMATKLFIGAAAIVGAGAVAYIAAPYLVYIGIAEAVASLVGGAAAAGVGASWALDKILTRSLIDKQYNKVLAYIITQLYQKHQGIYKNQAYHPFSSGSQNQLKSIEYIPVGVSPTRELLRDVDDLVGEGTTYSLEKALLLLYDKKSGLENFKGSDVEVCTEESKKALVKRIECIEIVHGIRKTLAQQCYIGVVGTQDAGKTTFLRQLWGIGGRTGQFAHTDTASLFEIEKRLAVIDYPGSNSLEHHAETFSVCGVMNNLLVIIIPYTGDISKSIWDEIKLAFEVTAGSEATKMILCINQCGLKLPTAIESELTDKADPIEFLKQRFASGLNDYATKGHQHVNVCKDDIFFTDWLLDDKTRNKYGISGVEEIKEEIKTYLLKQKIFEKKEADLLEDCLSHNFPARTD